MLEQVNWIAVAVAALLTFVVGGPWYSPAMFLIAWQKEVKLVDSQPGHPAKVFGLAYLFSFVSCALLATLITPHAARRCARWSKSRFACWHLLRGSELRH